MCGLAGYYSPTHYPSIIPERMASTLHQRGPDDTGVWSDSDIGITLVHRRLAIIDLSPAGHQPMLSNSGRYALVYNGEVYNHQQLRQQLPNLEWRGQSDTETLLASIEHWGVEETLRQATGMFSIALWDRHQKTLTLARDRMGEKPLYYGWQGNSFLFSSELKAMRVHPDFQGEINRQALTLLLRHNVVPAPYSIYENIHKLKPGCMITIPLELPRSGVLPQSIPYWSLKQTIKQAKDNPFVGTDEQAIMALESTLTAAIQQQQLADVPIGAFLSGGIDSSTIVALMQKHNQQSINTFTIGFDSQTHNEAQHAKLIAEHLGTNHTELYVNASDALSVIPQLSQLYDEPFADSSQIPTYLVAKLARQHVTVALSGDAGDELFAGYNRYFWVQRIWSKISLLPTPLRRQLARMMTVLPVSQWDKLNQFTQLIQPKRLRNAQLGEKLHKLANRIADVDTVNDLYYRLVSEWQYPEDVVLNAQEPNTLLTESEKWPTLSDHREVMMYLDSMTYLSDDILTKVDRAAMGVSLETRVPFLDHNVIEFAWRLPMDMKVREGQGKWLLRQVLYRHVPKALIERPKMGFSIPLDQWLRSELRDWAEALLDEDVLKHQGYFNHIVIRKRWKEHLSGERNWYSSLWSVLMFQAWFKDQS